MLVIKNLSAEVPDTNAFHWKLERHSENGGDAVLFYGYNSYKTGGKLHPASGKRNILFNNWMPCEFAQQSTDGFNATTYDHNFGQIYTICPYSAKWLNEFSNSGRYKTIFYPFHTDLIPDDCDKVCDVIYHGGIHGKEHVECLEVMSKFNYQYLTMTNNIGELTIRCLPYATSGNLPFKEKIKAISKSKISICYNLVHNRPEHINKIKTYEKWEDNIAFSELDGWGVMPQFKTRMHEAAFSKTLNLVQRDPWNIAEQYYKPGEEFIYFDNKEDLRDKIQEITSNWSEYEKVVSQAYDRSLNYTVENFFDIIKNDDQWKGINDEL